MRNYYRRQEDETFGVGMKEDWLGLGRIIFF